MQNVKRETEYLEIAAQNNAVRTDYVEAKIDMTENIEYFCSLLNFVINRNS